MTRDNYEGHMNTNSFMNFPLMNYEQLYAYGNSNNQFNNGYFMGDKQLMNISCPNFNQNMFYGSNNSLSSNNTNTQSFYPAVNLNEYW